MSIVSKAQVIGVLGTNVNYKDSKEFLINAAVYLYAVSSIKITQSNSQPSSPGIDNFKFEQKKQVSYNLLQKHKDTVKNAIDKTAEHTRNAKAA
ncbi:MAG: hypothetical protein ACO222_07300, partial [Polynucleobacter sp.]